MAPLPHATLGTEADATPSLAGEDGRDGMPACHECDSTSRKHDWHSPIPFGIGSSHVHVVGSHS